MPLASERVAKRIRRQNGQSGPDHLRRRFREDLKGDCIVEPAGRLQIELRSPAGQYGLPAKNNAPCMHARRKLREPNRRSAVAKAVIGAGGWRAEAGRICELKSFLWILVG